MLIKNAPIDRNVGKVGVARFSRIQVIRSADHRSSAALSSSIVARSPLDVVFTPPSFNHSVTDLFIMVNIPKERKTFCKSKKCSKHTMHKVRAS